MSTADELSGGNELRTSGLTLKAFPTEGALLHVAQDRVNDTLMQFGKDGLRDCAKMSTAPDICFEIVL